MSRSLIQTTWEAWRSGGGKLGRGGGGVPGGAGAGAAGRGAGRQNTRIRRRRSDYFRERVARVTKAPGGARLDLDPWTMTLPFSDSVRYYDEEATDSIP